MSNVQGFYKSLFTSQQSYLVALHEFAMLYPNACCELFDMKNSHVSVMASHGKEDWYKFVSGLKSWILVPRTDITNNCLFNYWLNNIQSNESIVNQINARIILGRRVSSHVVTANSISRCQSSILMSICMCAEFDPLFAKGLLFLNDSTIDSILRNFPMSNKLHFNDPFLPLFVFNKNLDFTKVMCLGRTAYAHVEQSLFKMAS